MTKPATDPRAERENYYRQIAAHSMTPLWEVLAALVPFEPRSPCVPAIWRYGEVRPWLMESGRLISAQEAVRRVLILENPGLPGSSAVTQSLYAGLQLILPGEVAPSHRHTQSALRLIVEGSGAYTAVEGERATMHPGDFIITPSWTWHDHGNDAQGPVVWLDGLDIPMIRFFDCGFAENYPQASQPVARPEGDALARYGANLLPVDYEPAAASSPVFAYPYARTREALHVIARNGAPHAAHGYKMQFINPASGGPAMPTMAAFVQLLPAGLRGAGCRSTDGTVFHAIEGAGSVTIGEQRFDFTARDTFVVPAWNAYRFETAAETVLFSFSDRPLQRAIGAWREEVLAAPG
jgi:gentisate 1,2-dioxygenase